MAKSYLAGICVAASLLLLALQPARAEEPRTVTIKQVSSGRFLTVQRSINSSDNVVTAPYQGARSHWIMVPQGNGIYTFMHLRTGTYLDAHEVAAKDFHLVTRPRQTFDSTQLWQVVVKSKEGYTIMQVSSGRFMDAHEVPELEYGAVSRPRQNNATQLWMLTPQP